MSGKRHVRAIGMRAEGFHGKDRGMGGKWRAGQCEGRHTMLRRLKVGSYGNGHV
jgi:hypothetical protein